MLFFLKISSENNSFSNIRKFQLDHLSNLLIKISRQIFNMILYLQSISIDKVNEFDKFADIFDKFVVILPNKQPLIDSRLSSLYFDDIYPALGDYNTALEYYQKTQKLQEKSLRPSHPSLAATYNNIADIQRKLGYDKVELTLYKKIT
ncbi:unnamed protein product [Rotaria sordida]|uniref:Uncharacterized protein n=1 Tax=Rotaria sordida TaxID=392033 RepID=A0A814VGY5_9BILA|nr:unnamed protein product [Rotaria sordida]CAF1641441.1 unnamed protein product [Rotaria sordida]